MFLFDLSMGSILAAIMVPMTVTVCKHVLHFFQFSLGSTLMYWMIASRLQLQPLLASPLDVFSAKETSSHHLAEHLHMNGVLKQGHPFRRCEVPSEIFHHARVLLLLRHDVHCHMFPGSLLLLVFDLFLLKGWKYIPQEVASLARFRPILNLL